MIQSELKADKTQFVISEHGYGLNFNNFLIASIFHANFVLKYIRKGARLGFYLKRASREWCYGYVPNISIARSQRIHCFSF